MRVIPALVDAELTSVIAGLDPEIHHFANERLFPMDARVKPAHDGSRITTAGITTLGTIRINDRFFCRQETYFLRSRDPGAFTRLRMARRLRCPCGLLLRSVADLVEPDIDDIGCQLGR